MTEDGGLPESRDAWMNRMGSFGTDGKGNTGVGGQMTEDGEQKTEDAPVKFASLVMGMPRLNNGKNGFNGVKISWDKDE